MRTAPSLLLLLPLLAGCTSPAVDGPMPGTDPTFAFGAPVKAFEACENRFRTCFEPTIAASPDGLLFATSAIGGPVARSKDNGTTWEKLSAPAVAGGPQGAVHNDVMVQVDAKGRLYFSSLITTIQGGVVLHGIQVSRSDDQGASWPVRTYVGLPSSRHTTEGADRQWLAFGPGDVVYLQYHRIDPALVAAAPIALLAGDIRLARSDDAGRSFGDFVAASNLGGHIGGQPAVNAAGHLFVPFFEYTPSDLAAGNSKLYVAKSTDQGRTFQRTQVEVPGPSSAGDFFPIAVVDGGRVHVVWKDAQATVRLATLEPGASRWSAPSRLSGGNTSGSPWAVAGAERMHVAWTEREGDRAQIVYATVHANGTVAGKLPASPRFNVSGARPNTDFTHFALLPGEMPAVVWSNGARDIQVAVAGWHPRE